MSELSVVHANELVEASYSLGINELRLIALACTRYDSRRQSVGEITITVDEFAKAYSITNKRVYGDLKAAVKAIMRKPIRLFNQETDEVEEFAWLTKNAYKRGDGSRVVIKFSPEIEPYLFEVGENFTKIHFEYASRLTTPFSFRLYQWLKKVENLRQHRKGETRAVELNVDWMKKQAGIEQSYKRFGDFKDYVIEPAIRQINSETDISVMYKTNKVGRKVNSIEFGYVVERGAFAKPQRPRLQRRPKVVKGSDAEGVWMRKNLKLLLDYEKALKEYDLEAKMTLSDLRKMAEYASIVDSRLVNRIKKEIKSRSYKPAA